MISLGNSSRKEKFDSAHPYPWPRFTSKTDDRPDRPSSPDFFFCFYFLKLRSPPVAVRTPVSPSKASFLPPCAAQYEVGMLCLVTQGSISLDMSPDLSTLLKIPLTAAPYWSSASAVARRGG
jgi:hypothetical protein